MALLTLDDLAEVMGRASRPFAGDEIGPAQFIIDRVEAFIESQCYGIAFEPTDTTEKMQADYYGVIEINRFPLNSVADVSDKKQPDTYTYWEFDEEDTIYGLYPFQTVLVTYNYGFEEAPTNLVIVAKSLALRGMSNPLNVRQQTVGAISETYSTPGLTQEDMAILALYQKSNYSLRIGPSTSFLVRTNGLPLL